VGTLPGNFVKASELIRSLAPYDLGVDANRVADVEAGLQRLGFSGLKGFTETIGSQFSALGLAELGGSPDPLGLANVIHAMISRELEDEAAEAWAESYILRKAISSKPLISHVESLAKGPSDNNPSVLDPVDTPGRREAIGSALMGLMGTSVERDWGLKIATLQQEFLSQHQNDLRDMNSALERSRTSMAALAEFLNDAANLDTATAEAILKVEASWGNDMTTRIADRVRNSTSPEKDCLLEIQKDWNDWISRRDKSVAQERDDMRRLRSSIVGVQDESLRQARYFTQWSTGTWNATDAHAPYARQARPETSVYVGWLLDEVVRSRAGFNDKISGQ
jgi:hypothetical protein